ncbi:MAG: hypothetical protein U5R06_22920 [candidate division KSB1 bacterium]|nr:hypothetical protein [candidate division KSB1 bacterium]
MRLFFLLCFIAGTLFAQDDHLIEFEIKDQFDRLHTHHELQDSVAILIGSGRPGSKYNMQWGNQLGRRLEENGLFEKVIFVAHADLRGVPGFLKGFVTSKFPQDKQKWTLMDWDGVLAQAYQYNPKTSNILVFNRNGVLVEHMTGLEPTNTDIDTLYQIIKPLAEKQPH